MILFYFFFFFMLFRHQVGSMSMPLNQVKSTKRGNSSSRWRTWSRKMAGTRARAATRSVPPPRVTLPAADSSQNPSISNIHTRLVLRRLHQALLPPPRHTIIGHRWGCDPARLSRSSSGKSGGVQKQVLTLDLRNVLKLPICEDALHS